MPTNIGYKIESIVKENTQIQRELHAMRKSIETNQEISAKAKRKLPVQTAIV